MCIFNTTRILTLCLMLGLTYSLQSCKKADEKSSEQTTAQDYSQAESEVNKSQDATDIVGNQLGTAKTEALNLWYLPTGTSIFIDSISAIHSITVDFTAAGLVCTNWDGRTRAGKIITTWTGRYRDPGTIKTTTTNGYKVNGKAHTFNRTVTNIGLVNGYPTFTSTASANVEADNGNFTYASSRTRSWVAGSSTPDPSDDVYNLFGTANGTHPNGNSFTVVVPQTTPLHVQLGCRPRHITSGSADFNITRSGTTTAYSVDYGNGTCGSYAYLNRDGRRWLLLFY